MRTDIRPIRLKPIANHLSNKTLAFFEFGSVIAIDWRRLDHEAELDF